MAAFVEIPAKRWKAMALKLRCLQIEGGSAEDDEWMNGNSALIRQKRCVIDSWGVGGLW